MPSLSISLETIKKRLELSHSRNTKMKSRVALLKRKFITTKGIRLWMKSTQKAWSSSMLRDTRPINKELYSMMQDLWKIKWRWNTPPSSATSSLRHTWPIRIRREMTCKNSWIKRHKNPRNTWLGLNSIYRIKPEGSRKVVRRLRRSATYNLLGRLIGGKNPVKLMSAIQD